MHIITVIRLIIFYPVHHLVLNYGRIGLGPLISPVSDSKALLCIMIPALLRTCKLQEAGTGKEGNGIVVRGLHRDKMKNEFHTNREFS